MATPRDRIRLWKFEKKKSNEIHFPRFNRIEIWNFEIRYLFDQFHFFRQLSIRMFQNVQTFPIQMKYFFTIFQKMFQICRMPWLFNAYSVNFNFVGQFGRLKCRCCSAKIANFDNLNQIEPEFQNVPNFEGVSFNFSSIALIIFEALEREFLTQQRFKIGKNLSARHRLFCWNHQLWSLKLNSN